jgi:hypothetical protein
MRFSDEGCYVSVQKKPKETDLKNKNTTGEALLNARHK